MSNIEIALIVVACLIPVVALVIVLPKHIKKKKSKPEVKTEPYVPLTKEEPKPAEQPKPTDPIANYNTDEFKSYLNKRKENMSKPKRNEFDPLKAPFTEGYFPRRPMSTGKKEQTLSEEIQNLSPELKALIISGVLDKKNFDD